MQFTYSHNVRSFLNLMKRIIFIQIENHFVDLNYTCTKASIKNLWSIKLMMTLKWELLEVFLWKPIKRTKIFSLCLYCFMSNYQMFHLNIYKIIASGLINNLVNLEQWFVKCYHISVLKGTLSLVLKCFNQLSHVRRIIFGSDVEVSVVIMGC